LALVSWRTCFWSMISSLISVGLLMVEPSIVISEIPVLWTD
jgi:hypothetical protein